MAEKTDYYTNLKRSMFRRINEVGAKPFLLFQYYLTYTTAPKINPSLKTIALDMGILDKHGKPQISAVCHLKKELVNAGWIKEENGEITITIQLENVEKISTEQLRKSQSEVEKISIDSLENLNKPLRNSQSPYIRNEKEQLERKEEVKEREEYTPAPEQFQTSIRNLQAKEAEDAFIPRADSFSDCEALMFFEETFRVTSGGAFAEAVRARIKNIAVWKALIRDKIGYADKPKPQRQNIQNWILQAYDERLEKENAKLQRHSNGRRETEHERRNREAAERIKFDEIADDILEREGIIQVSSG